MIFHHYSNFRALKTLENLLEARSSIFTSLYIVTFLHSEVYDRIDTELEGMKKDRKLRWTNEERYVLIRCASNSVVFDLSVLYIA